MSAMNFFRRIRVFLQAPMDKPLGTSRAPSLNSLPFTITLPPNKSGQSALPVSSSATASGTTVSQPASTHTALGASFTEEYDMSLKSFMAALALVPSVDGLVNTVVQSVETAVAPATAGNVKFAAAEAKVNAILAAVVSDIATLASLKPIIGVLIDAAVAMFNAAGLFKHATAGATAAAAQLNPPAPSV